MKKILKPFDIKKAKGGAKIVTRDGRSVRIICYDKNGSNDGPIVALVDDNGIEKVRSYYNNGNYYINCPDHNDLRLVEQQKFEKGDVISDELGDITIFEGLLYNHQDTGICNVILFNDGFLHFAGTTVDLNKAKLATEEEKRRLFEALEKYGKRWNPDKKCIEIIKSENKYDFKRGQAVLVRDNHDSFWKLALFIDYNRNTAYSYLTTSGGKKLCIDYDSHRDLLYQFDNPE